MEPIESPERVLAIGAHPDDIDFGAGGTVAKLAANGAEVTYCLITDGDAGGFDPDVPRSQIPRIRQAEQQAAAETLGVASVVFLGYHDGELTITHGLRRDISRTIRQVRPDLALIQSPIRNLDRMYASHPDHLAAGEAAMQAIYPDARNPFAHPSLLADEGLDAWTVPQVWIMGNSEPNHWVDVRPTLDLKIKALLRHESQTAHMENLPTFIEDWGRRNAAEAGLESGLVVEAFRALDTA
jgi:LmbE family N-acetylglucosaminyl deacetylase